MHRLAAVMVSSLSRISSALHLAIRQLAWRGRRHVRTNQLQGEEVEVLAGTVILQMLGDTDLRSDDKFLLAGVFGILNNAGGGADIVRLFTDGRNTLGMHEQLGVGIERLSAFDLLHGDRRMNRAAAVEQLDILVGALLRDKAAEVAVGNKEDIVIIDFFDDLHRRGAGDADVADGFELRRGVDIGDDRIAGIVLLDLLDHLLVHLVCHIAARERLRQQDGLFGREQLAGFRHKAHAAHQNRLIVHLRGVDAQLIAVARVVGNLTDFSCLIAVSQNANVLFFF